jgi:hypothetical protein
MQFSNRFVDKAKDVHFAFQDLPSHCLKVNKEILGKAADKPTKTKHAKMVDVVVEIQETIEIAEIEGSLKKNGKKRVANLEGKEGTQETHTQ